MNLLSYSMLLGYGRSSNRHYRDFKKGDRIILTHSFIEKNTIGATGTILKGDGTCFHINWDSSNETLRSRDGVIIPMRIDLIKNSKNIQN